MSIDKELQQDIVQMVLLNIMCLFIGTYWILSCNPENLPVVVLSVMLLAMSMTALGILAIYENYNKRQRSIQLRNTIIKESIERQNERNPQKLKIIRECNLDRLLSVVHRQFVALKDEEFKVNYSVLCEVFKVLQENMKAVDPYYAQYSSRKRFTGSHADNLRIGRPDEFDLDIVIRMPFCYAEAPNPEESDLVIESHVQGHVHVRGGKQYETLPYRDNWDINKTAYKWFDRDGYILRTRFTDWFKSVVVRALNRLPKKNSGFPIVEINDDVYCLRTRDSGPAYTLIIHRDDEFQIDVDLVPVLKFPEDRWPPSPDYRDISWEYAAGDWMLVPKQARHVYASEESSRSWRVALPIQESRLIHNSQRLRQTIRFVKKLRDALNMKEIASYYIKTLFLWEAVEREDPFWHQSESTLFTVMVRRLYDALHDRRIRYFWNEENNLIGHIHPQLLKCYELKLKELVHLLEESQVDVYEVAKFLLTPSEYEIYLYNPW